MAGSFCSMARSNASMLWWAGPGVRNTSVDAAQIITRRSALDVVAVERRWDRSDAVQEGRHGLEVLGLEHARLFRRGVRVIRNRIPRREHQVGEPRQGQELANLRRTLFGPLPETDRPHLRE